MGPWRMIWHCLWGPLWALRQRMLLQELISFARGSLFSVHTEGCQLTLICHVWFAAFEEQILCCSAFSGREHCCLIRAEICWWTLYEEVCSFFFWLINELLSLVMEPGQYLKIFLISMPSWQLLFQICVSSHLCTFILQVAMVCFCELYLGLSIHGMESQNLTAADLVNKTGSLSFLLWKSHSLISAY